MTISPESSRSEQIHNDRTIGVIQNMAVQVSHSKASEPLMNRVSNAERLPAESTEEHTLFDYSVSASYNNNSGSTISAKLAPSDVFARNHLVDTDGQDLLGKTALVSNDRKAGRPNHPAWEHFMRGEKRNRFHHHAYCKYCMANGIEPTPIRGVSGNMMRHLQKCVYCPDGTVAQLRNVCAQKDAVNFSKKHQSHTGNAGSLLYETVHPSLKKPKLDKCRSERISNSLQVSEEFIPLQLNVLPTTVQCEKCGVPSSEAQYQCRYPIKEPATLSEGLCKKALTTGMYRVTPVDHAKLNQQLFRAMVSRGLPQGWVFSHGKICRVIDVNLNDRSPINEIDLHRYMRNDRTGQTLIVTFRFLKSRRTGHVQLSLFDGDDVQTVAYLSTIEDSVSVETLSSKIEKCLVELLSQDIAVHTILADSALAVAACQKVIAGAQLNGRLLVLPCFAHTLKVLIGVILTGCTSYSRAMAQVLMIVHWMCEKAPLSAVRQECGDSSLQFSLPSLKRWDTFVECVDCVRQYEDVIKAIAATQETFINEAVRETIENSGFWDKVVSLSELMSPIKETYSLMEKRSPSSMFALSDMLYQFGRMSQQYEGILHDWQENASGAGRDVQHVQRVQECLERLWEMYDHRLLVLAYSIDYRMPSNSLDRRHPMLQWISVCKSARELYRQWLLREDSGELLQDLLAMKQKLYPFDLETTSEFENVRAFYLLISDTNVAIHQLGSRLFSIHPSPFLGTWGYWDVAEVAASAGHFRNDPGFASKAFAMSRSHWHQNAIQSANQSAEIMNWKPPYQAFSFVGDEKHWTRLASSWKRLCEEEMDFLRTTMRPPTDLGLNEVFSEKLASRTHQDLETSVVNV